LITLCTAAPLPSSEVLIPRSRVILEMFLVAQMVKKFPSPYENEGSLPCSKQPATGTYPRQLIPVHTHPASFPPILFKTTLPSILKSPK